MGELPEWYVTLRAAKLLGVAPWDLAAVPSVWRDWGIAADVAEHAAEQEIERHKNRRSGKRNK